MHESTPVLVPRETVNDESVILVDWCVANGTAVESGQALAEVEGSKSVFTIYAPVGGVVEYHLAPGCEVKVGGSLCTVGNANGALFNQAATDNKGAPGPSPAAKATKTEDIDSRSDDSGVTIESPVPPRFSQKAAALLRCHGIDPSGFARQGLVTANRVRDVLEQQKPSIASTSNATLEHLRSKLTPPEPLPALGVPVRIEKLTRSKQTEVRYLTSSYHNTLTSMVTVAVPTRGLKMTVTKSGFSGGSTAMVVFEVARLLSRYPAFNAYYEGGCMHVYQEINIGVAFDAGRGLKAPVIHRADHKGLKDIADEMQTLLLDYLENRLPLESMVGGTFTITDLSNDGVLTFHPLINQGQAAILGIGAEFFPPGSREGFFNLILSFDHQLAEGRSAAGFLRDLSQRLQAYETALAVEPDNRTTLEELHCAHCLTPLSRLRRLDPHGRGDSFLVPVVQPSGKTEYRCSVCVQGW